MQHKSKENRWKEKAKARREEIARLKKRIKEIKVSRDNWKAKYKEQQSKKERLSKEKPRGHQYPVVLIWLCLHVYNCCHCSFRNCCEMVVCSAMMLQIRCSKPCAASVRNWVIKYGYYCYYQPDEYSDKWAIIIDECVSIGQERLLLVLGLPLEKWKFDRAISHQDVRVFHISIATSWKAEAITKVLREVSSAIEVAYCVSDKGNNIMGAVKALGWVHIYDCSHQWAKLMEQLYSQTPDFVSLMKELSALRKRWVLSKQSHIMPPQLRSKARFLNIFPLVEWIENIRLHWKKLATAIKQQLSFLQQHKGVINELIILKKAIRQMGTLLKVKGMNKTTLQQCGVFLEGCQRGRPLQFKTMLQAAWAAYTPDLGQKTLLCCSDVIESYFGRFKQRIKSNGMQTLSESVLMMGGWSKQITRERIKSALAEVSMKNIYQWKKENTTDSLLKKRRVFFDKNRTKKK